MQPIVGLIDLIRKLHKAHARLGGHTGLHRGTRQHLAETEVPTDSGHEFDQVQVAVPIRVVDDSNGNYLKGDQSSRYLITKVIDGD